MADSDVRLSLYKVVYFFLEVAMRNPFNDLLTKDEQKILWGLCFLFLLGAALQFLGFNPILAKANTETKRELQQTLLQDQKLSIDIRSAGSEELMLLPGIGAKRAADIIAYRSATPFTTVYELQKIKGIGPKTLDKLLPMLLIFGADSLMVHSNPEAKPKPKAKKQESVNSKIVNINSAGLEELITLQGIGETKAKAILEYRAQNGRFDTVEDICKVKGIGAKTLEKNRARLAI